MAYVNDSIKPDPTFGSKRYLLIHHIYSWNGVTMKIEQSHVGFDNGYFMG